MQGYSEIPAKFWQWILLIVVDHHKLFWNLNSLTKTIISFTLYCFTLQWKLDFDSIHVFFSRKTFGAIKLHLRFQITFYVSLLINESLTLTHITFCKCIFREEKNTFSFWEYTSMLCNLAKRYQNNTVCCKYSDRWLSCIVRSLPDSLPTC